MAEMSKAEARELVAWARRVASEQPKVAGVLADVDRAVESWRASAPSTKALHLGSVRRHVGRLGELRTPKLG